jgi:hypothetical protein
MNLFLKEENNLTLIYKNNLCNLKGLEQGRLSINLCPCLPSGKVLNEEQFVDQPDELLDKPYSFKVIIFISIIRQKQ